MLKNWCIYILTLIGTFFFFLFYQMWFSWYCLCLLLLIPILSLVMCLFSAAFYRFEVNSPKNVKLGDKVSIRYSAASNKLTVFSFYKIVVGITDLMTDEKTKLILTGNGIGEMSCPVDTSHCGAFSYEIEKLRIYDLFGLFFISRFSHNKSEIIVRPVPHMPRLMPDLNGFKARHLQKSNSPYSEIYDVRDYMLGDPVKNIHWKASAKKDMLLIKEPQEECHGHARVFLALSQDRTKLDRKLGELFFTCDYFLSRDIPHKIRILPPLRREVAFDIQSSRDLETAILKILHLKIPKEGQDEK